MSKARAEQGRRSRDAQILLFIYTFIFITFIGYGYFNLFLSFGTFIAMLFGLAAAFLAWYMARQVGEAWARKASGAALFVPLLLVSAAGVYSSLMLYLEGGQVLIDATNRADADFGALQQAALVKATADGAPARVANVRRLTDALFSEIRNPGNCGQGPHARDLIAELQRALPGFTPLSQTHNDCGHNDEVVADYQRRIDGLLARADWPGAELMPIVAKAGEARQAIAGIRSDVTTGYRPGKLREEVSLLEAQDATYRDLRSRLGDAVDVKGLADGLPLTAAQSLGNAAKLPSLFLDRLDQASTYVYLLLALGFDTLMCYFVANNARSRRVRPVAVTATTVPSGW